MRISAPCMLSAYGSCGGRGEKKRLVSTLGARSPGALDITCASPCGKSTRSPAARRIGDSPVIAAQHDPSTRPWNSIMWSTPGMMAGMISGAAGASATQGEAPSM